MRCKTGEVYWYTLPGEYTEKPIPHPHVVLEVSHSDTTRTASVTVCGITTNMKKASWPGNIILNINEAGLTRLSIVDVSQVRDVPENELGEYIGTLSDERVAKIRSGIAMVRTLQENNRKNNLK